MIINAESISGLFRGFSTSFNQGLTQAKSEYQSVAMTVPSGTREMTYAWMGQIPRLREWLGSRVIQNVTAYGYTITNRKFELTIEVPRDDIEDDTYGVFGPLFEEMGRSAAVHPDELIFGLLASGFTEPCYDKQYFFDSDHPSVDENGETVSVSNVQAGGGPAWYLFDTSRAIKPLIYQKRVDYTFQHLDRDNDRNVFLEDSFLYGIRGRVNAGFGLWQLAYGSMADLTPENYALARAAMMELRGDQGKLLGIMPDTLVVPPGLEGAGREILVADRNAAGAANIWFNSAKLITTPWLVQ